MHSIPSVAMAGLLIVATVSAKNATVECAKGLKMFVSRGTDEPLGVGETGKLAKAIAEQIDGSDYEAILYPASNPNPPEGVPSYFQSVANGTELVKKAVTEYASACPDAKMAFFGYSQGAQITSNSFCGMPLIWAVQAGYNGTTEFDKIVALATPLSEEVTKNVVSVVLFGDPTSRNDTSYTYGTWNNTGNGIFYRSDTSACEAYGDRIRSYCGAGDPFCDVGDFIDPVVHLKYIQNYGEEIAKYVVQQYNGGDSGDSSDSDDETSPTSTPSSTPPNGAAGFVPTSSVAVVAAMLAYFAM
ncbi:Fc.00g084480.m01.CDS01 [Cosmosporella sp. VM-42]